MKKLTKRMLALLLSGSMLFAILAGCTSTPAENSSTGDDPSTSEPAGNDPDSNEPGNGNTLAPEDDPLLNNEETINLTVFSQTANWSGAQTGWGATLLKDKFNIELTIIPDTNGAYQTRMESKDLGDIIVWGSNGDEYAAAVNQGLLFNWDEEDLVETYGKDIVKSFSAALDANRAINADGGLYGIGNDLTDTEGQHNTFIYDWGIRWDLYQQLGHPAVKDLDSLADVLGQMKEICPTGDDGRPTYAFSIWPDWDGEAVMYVKALAAAYYGYDGDVPGLGLYDSTNGNFYDCLSEDGPYMESLRFFNKLYRMGLIDPDSMTQTYDQMMPKMKNGNCLMSIFDYAGSNLYNTPEHIAENKIMLPLVPEDANVAVWGLSTGGDKRIWSIGNNSMYPEKCMQFLNWLHTPDGAMTIWYGIKGLMWDYDADGRIVFTELGQACSTNPQYDLTGVEWTSPDTGKTYTLDGTFNDGMIQANNTTWALGAVNPNSAGERFNKVTWSSQAGEAKNEADADWRSVTNSKSNQAYMETVNYQIIPTVSSFTLPEREAELELKWNQVKVAVVNGSWNAMYAKDEAEFDSIVSKMRADADAYGYQECVDWCKEQAQIRFSMQ